MYEQISWFIIFFPSLAATGQVCQSSVAPELRIDCHPVVNTQSACEAATCVWCPDVPTNVAPCFLNVTTNFQVLLKAASNCRSVFDCDIAVNCHPDVITYSPSQASCESRGCLWLGNFAVNDRPKCVFHNNTVIGNNDLIGGAFPIAEVSAKCISCDSCVYKLECLPNEHGSRYNEMRCQREGCMWCADIGKCIIGAFSALDLLSPQCTSCDSCPFNAYIKSQSRDECIQKKGTYCTNRESSPDDRRCVIIGDTSQGECTLQKAMAGRCNSCDNECETSVDCSTDEFFENEISCIEKGCMWCHSNKTGPICRYGSNGHRCISEEFCDVEFPKFQNIQWELKTSFQRPHLLRLMEVLCYSQLGVWAPSTADKCLSASPQALAPLMRKMSVLSEYYHDTNYNLDSNAMLDKDIDIYFI